jgi:molecular chaperone GrpE
MQEMESDLNLMEKLQEPSDAEGAPAATEEAVPQVAVKKEPVESELSAGSGNFEGWRQFVRDLETDERGSVTVTDEDVATEMPAKTEPSLGPELVANPEQPSSQAEFDKLKAERDQLLDRLARLQAEFENARKRADRERSSDRDFATCNVVEKFLPVLDHFELALKASGSAEQLREGVELIVKQMEDALRQLQVTPIPAVGEEFDPRQHEALGTVERFDLPDQHVAEEIRRGYKLRDKLLRPALVRVASNPKQTSE